MTATHDAVQLMGAFRRQLELCAVKPGETVVVLTDRNAERQQVLACVTAAAELGNLVYEVHIDAEVMFNGAISHFDDPGLRAVLERPVLIMSFFPALTFAEWTKAVLKAGGRICSVASTSRQLLRLQSTPALRTAARAAVARVKQTPNKNMRVTNAAGTDFTWSIDEEGPIYCHYGLADEPGRRDQWGQGMVAHFPVEGSANGKVVIKPGDVWALPYQRLVNDPIELEVRDGFIRDIRGGGDAKMFRYALETASLSENDMDPFAISHLGWGLNPKARWDDVAVFNGNPDDLGASMRAFPGNFLFSTGPGFRRKTKGHIDMPMCDCTIELDGDVVVREGRLVAPEMIADPDRAYH